MTLLGYEIPLVAFQLSFMTMYAMSFDKGTYDPLGYGFRTMLVAVYTVCSWSGQSSYQTIPDWICQSICMVQFISVALNVFSFDRHLWRKDG